MSHNISANGRRSQAMAAEIRLFSTWNFNASSANCSALEGQLSRHADVAKVMDFMLKRLNSVGRAMTVASA